ncbi:MAG: SET domain-containing protein-lysine N-methyltransferase [Verrucomicrobia bacterium]|nr:SET domain-containing protein-lysine N-methyltransferase [Verrucomicrobiota bacterium]
MSVTVEVKPSPIHGTGVFASEAFSKGARVLEYTGERISQAESLRRCEAQNDYIFALDDEWNLDGNVPWNPARFINHSCAPNCDAERVEGRIWIVARRNIAAGEELTFNYSYDLTDYREHPCRCGAEEFVGFIVAEEYFPTVRRKRVLAAQ